MAGRDDLYWIRKTIEDIHAALDTHRISELNREVETAAKHLSRPFKEFSEMGARLEAAVSAGSSHLDEVLNARHFPVAAEIARLLPSVPNSVFDPSSLTLEARRSLNAYESNFQKVASNVPWASLADQVSADARLLGDSFARFHGGNLELLSLAGDQARTALEAAIASSLPMVSMLARELASGFATGSLSPALAEGFGGELLEKLHEAATIESEEAAASFLSALLAWLLLQARRFGVATPNFALTILVTLGTLLYDNLQDSAQQERLVKELHTSTAILLEEISRMTPSDSCGRVALVRELVAARRNPGDSADVLAVLSQGQWVDVVDMSGPWVRVRIFDYVNGGECEAWVFGEKLLLPQE